MTTRRTLLKSVAAVALMSLAVPAYAAEQTKVVATFSILGNMVERIGGEHIDLTTLVGPGGDTHVYQPTPKDAAAVSQADVLIMNGLEFEGWLERLIESAGLTGDLAVATSGITPIAFDGAGHHHEEHDEHEEAEGHKEGHDHHADHHEEEGKDHAEGEAHDHHDDHDEHHEHADEHGHHHGAFDPHAWQSVENAMIYVDNITATLAKADPEHAGVFYANRAAYIAELEALQTEVASLMAALPEDKRTVVTSHDAFGYFAQAYDMQFEAPQGLSTESEPSAADVAALITQIRTDGIAAVFVESITDNRLLQQIASETGAVIGGTLYSDSLSDKDGPAATYIDMIRHNATTLSKALGS